MTSSDSQESLIPRSELKTKLVAELKQRLEKTVYNLNNSFFIFYGKIPLEHQAEEWASSKESFSFVKFPALKEVMNKVEEGFNPNINTIDISIFQSQPTCVLTTEQIEKALRDILNPDAKYAVANAYCILSAIHTVVGILKSESPLSDKFSPNSKKCFSILYATVMHGLYLSAKEELEENDRVCDELVNFWGNLRRYINTKLYEGSHSSMYEEWKVLLQNRGAIQACLSSDVYELFLCIYTLVLMGRKIASQKDLQQEFDNNFPSWMLFYKFDNLSRQDCYQVAIIIQLFRKCSQSNNNPTVDKAIPAYEEFDLSWINDNISTQSVTGKTLWEALRTLERISSIISNTSWLE